MKKHIPSFILLCLFLVTGLYTRPGVVAFFLTMIGVYYFLYAVVCVVFDVFENHKEKVKEIELRLDALEYKPNYEVEDSYEWPSVRPKEKRYESNHHSTTAKSELTGWRHAVPSNRNG